MKSYNYFTPEKDEIDYIISEIKKELELLECLEKQGFKVINRKINELENKLNSQSPGDKSK